jgi:hypothetical protein
MIQKIKICGENLESKKNSVIGKVQILPRPIKQQILMEQIPNKVDFFQLDIIGLLKQLTVVPQTLTLDFSVGVDGIGGGEIKGNKNIIFA